MRLAPACPTRREDARHGARVACGALGLAEATAEPESHPTAEAAAPSICNAAARAAIVVGAAASEGAPARRLARGGFDGRRDSAADGPRGYAVSHGVTRSGAPAALLAVAMEGDIVATNKAKSQRSPQLAETQGTPFLSNAK